MLWLFDLLYDWHPSTRTFPSVSILQQGIIMRTEALRYAWYKIKTMRAGHSPTKYKNVWHKKNQKRTQFQKQKKKILLFRFNTDRRDAQPCHQQLHLLPLHSCYHWVWDLEAMMGYGVTYLYMSFENHRKKEAVDGRKAKWPCMTVISNICRLNEKLL